MMRKGSIGMLDGFNQEMEILDFSALTQRKQRSTCITIGNFDGVHLGHQAIIRRMLREACPENFDVLVVTFFPNPSVFFNQGGARFYLTSPREKREILLDLGVDSVLTFAFDRDFANLTPKAFLRGLKEKLGLVELVVGSDFALGKNRLGTLPVIRSLGEELGFAVKVISPISVDDEVISSTQIRKLLEEGAVRRAAEKLGRRYTMRGIITHGSDRGSRIGLPTANLSHWPLKKLPGLGVYATYVLLDGRRFPALTNVGLRPTFEIQTAPNVETHILNFDEDIYGERMTLEFVEKIREERKFSGVKAFIEQIAKDKRDARSVFDAE